MVFNAAPGNAPSNVTATTLSSTEILATWDTVPHINQNGAITMYQVLYTPLQTFGGAIGVKTMNVTEQAALLANLEAYVDYSVSVQDSTRIGVGPYSSGMMEMTLQDGA